MSEGGRDQRRFSRVHFRRDFGASDRITKAHIHWRNLEFSDVFDLGLGGLAASKPSMMEFQKDETVDFNLELGDAPVIAVRAKVAWVRDFSVGFSFTRMEPEGHRALHRFLSSKLVGSNLKRMQTELLPAGTGFDQWYSGPKETFLFLKMSSKNEFPKPVEKAEIQVDGETFLFEDERVLQGEGLVETVIQILTHAPEDEVDLHTLLAQILKVSK
jgi:hypothetical protein